MADEARPPLDADTLRALTRAAGLALSADELAALLPPAAALYAAIDRLDALGLADTEPPHCFGLEGAQAMDADQIAYLSVADLAEHLQRRDLSPVEVTRVFLDRIAAHDPALCAYITVTGEQALAQAATAEQELAAGQRRGPLHGVPLALKDLFYTAGVRTTAGSRILGDFVPTEDAAVVSRLRAAGAIFLGKTNMEEFAYGATSINPHYGACRNPWDRERIAGGSSGGSAAALAAGLCAATLGSDSGGSIRQPAALCGLVGLKPTYGLVSRHGVVPLSWSQDHVGPLARTVRDAALLLQAIAGHDPRDPASSRAPLPDYLATLEDGAAGLRLAVPRDFFFDHVDPQVERAVRAAAQVLGGLGATLDDIPLPQAPHLVTSGATILIAEATAFHESWLRTRPQDYGPLVLARLRVGNTVLATDLLKAQRARGVLVAQTTALFDRYDALLTPTVPVAAPGQTETTIQWPDGVQEDVRGTTLRFTRPFNLLGFPAVSVPCGFTDAGLPIGLQIVGRPFAEAKVLRLARAYEAATDWGSRRPALG